MDDVVVPTSPFFQTHQLVPANGFLVAVVRRPQTAKKKESKWLGSWRKEGFWLVNKPNRGETENQGPESEY